MRAAALWIAIGLCMLATPRLGLAQRASTEPAQDRAGATRDSEVSTRKPADPLAAALARYAHEPSIAEVLRAALAAHYDPTNQALRERARLSGWVPIVGLKARRGQGVDLASSAADEGLRLSTDDDLTLEAALTFHLERVVFADEEVALAREARGERGDASKRGAEIIRLYFERRRLQLERALLSTSPTDPKRPEDQDESSAGSTAGTNAGSNAGANVNAATAAQAEIARAMRIAEIEAQLDAFTGGAFRRMIRRSQRPVKTSSTRP